MNDVGDAVLHAYGSLFFAAAPALEDASPNAAHAQSAVVIVHWAGDSTSVARCKVLERCAQTLQAHGGRLVLGDNKPPVRVRLARTGLLVSRESRAVTEPSRNNDHTIGGSSGNTGSTHVQE